MLTGIPTLKIVAVAAAVVAAVGYVQHLRIQSLKSGLRDAQQQVAILNIQRDELAAANRQCVADVERQNAAVQALKVEADRRAEAGRIAIAAAVRQSAGLQAEIERLRAQAMPVPGDACASADALLRQAIEQRKVMP